MKNYKIGIFFTSAAIFVFVLLFFFAPSVMIDGIRKGLTVCGMSVIPSLFPMMVLSDYIVRSGLGNAAGRFLAPATQKLFKLPGSAGCAVIMGLTGGFPVGTRMAAQLYENGEITQKQGRRMLLFCVNAGPAFVIGTVGAAMLSNKKAGLLLFISLTLASLAVGIASRILEDGKETVKEDAMPVYDSGVIAESVSQGTQAVLNICAWILIFSGLNEYVAVYSGNESVLVWTSVLTEVTGGCLAAAGRFPVYITALVLGWSGLAVHCQLLPYLKKLNMKITHLWLSRIIVGGIATAIAWILFRLFPCEVSAFSSSSEIMTKPYSVSVPSAAAVLMLSALMLIDIKPCTKEKDVL